MPGGRHLKGTRRRGAWALLAALALAAGCATYRPPALRHEASLETAVGTFHVRFAEGDGEGARAVGSAIEAAAPTLARWGRLREPVVVHVLPSHEALEQAVHRPGFGWLRAWARYDVVYLQSPRTWSLVGAHPHDVDELVLHELTHCLMYQLAADRLGWSRKGIPLWFREGMASYVAKQAWRWPGLESLARFLEGSPDLDPVGAPEALYRSESDIVYAAAHHAFGFLVRRYGEARVQEVLARMARGSDFADAFEEGVGLSVPAFTADFGRYVRLRAYRAGRALPPRPAAGADSPP